MSNRTIAAKDSRPEENPFDLSSQYKFLKILGWGGFGVVLRCLKRDTRERVAIKIPIYKDIKQEAALMKRFMRHRVDQHNIVKLLDSFKTRFGKALVFEELDINLMEFLARNRSRPMLLRDIRSVIRQTATALEALRIMGVIHTDIKPDNIMLVNRRKRPLEVKMIDFGLAISLRNATQGRMLQTEEFRAPEVILGLPLNEAIDMWSVGCMMGIMVAGGLLYTGDDEYELLQCMSRLLGQPPDRLLNRGMFTNNYFVRTKPKGWRLKTPEEYWGRETYDRQIGLRSLDDLKNMRYEPHNRTEGLEREQCIELLKAMLTLDATQRITPSEILSHPFILWNQEDNSSCDDRLSSWTSSSEDYKTTDTNIQPDDSSASPVMTKDVIGRRLSQPLVIYIQAAPPVDTVQTDSLQPGVTKTSERLELRFSPEPGITMTDQGNDTRNTEQTLPSSPGSELSPKKKKNCVQRFFSWIKKKFR